MKTAASLKKQHSRVKAVDTLTRFAELCRLMSSIPIANLISTVGFMMRLILSSIIVLYISHHTIGTFIVT